MKGVTALEVEILEFVGGFCIQVCEKSTISEYHQDIQKWDTLTADAFIRRFKHHPMPVVVSILQELVKLLSPVGPNEKNIVYVSVPAKRFQWVMLDDFIFQVPHK